MLAACSGETTEIEARTGGPIVLPPPLAETRQTNPLPAPPVVDPSEWDLPPPEEDPAHPPWLRLVWGQDNRGELEACGCPGSPSGGMARRRVFVRQLRDQTPDVFVLEGPTALSRAILGFETIAGEHRARGRVVLEMLAASQPDAFFPGQADFAVVTPPELARLADRHGLPLVATNLDPSVAGDGYARSFVREVDGRRVVFLGLVRRPATETLQQQAPVTPAVQAAAAEVVRREAEGPVDLVVAITDGDLRDIGRWRDAGLDIDLLLTGPEVSDKRVHYWAGDQAVVRADELGRAFRRLDIVFAGPPGRGLTPQDPPPWQIERVASLEAQYMLQRHRYDLLRAAEQRGEDPRESEIGADGIERVNPSTDPAVVQAGLAEIVALRHQALSGSAELPSKNLLLVSTQLIHPETPEDPEVKDRLDALAAKRLEELQALMGSVEALPASDLYTGREICAQCHPSVGAHWAITRHAGAWKTLFERGETRNPECLPCHTTGFAQAGGFTDPGAPGAMLNVECEACHGPMGLHVEQAGMQGVRPEPGLPVNEATCKRCHDPANSPRFEFDVYYPRVMHPGLKLPGGR